MEHSEYWTSIADIRAEFAAALAETSYYWQTNETIYPARWAGYGASGSCTTGCPYDRRHTLAAQHVAEEHSWDDLGECENTREAIAALIEVRDATEDAEAQLRDVEMSETANEED